MVFGDERGRAGISISDPQHAKALTAETLKTLLNLLLEAVEADQMLECSRMPADVDKTEDLSSLGSRGREYPMRKRGDESFDEFDEYPLDLCDMQL